MIKRVIFFSVSPLEKRDYKRFGIEVLRDNGFEVEFFDFSPFVNPMFHKKAMGSNEREGSVILYSKEAGLRAISRLTEECFVITLMNYRQKTFGIYRAISKIKVPYAVLVSNTVPRTDRQRPNIKSFLKKISKKTRSGLKKTGSDLIESFKGLPFRHAFIKYQGVREPNFIFAGGMESLGHPLASLAGKNTEILWLHTLDYDIYLDNIKNGKLQTEDSCKRAVFLDSPSPRFPHHELESDICYLTEERYYPSLCKFFDRMESRLGVKVEIADHPRGRHEMYPDCFGKRLTLHGQTFQMIMRSKIVISRASTATNFAVLLNKPVIFITTDEAETDAELSNDIYSMAAWLGKTPVNIDHLADIDWDNELSVDEASYCNYKNSFIKKEGTEDLNSWQIVANRLKSM